MRNRINSRVVPLLLIGALALFVASASQQQWLRSIEVLLYDTLLSNDLISISDDVIIVEIDDESLADLGAWPWSRDVHAKLLSELSHAKSVIFDIVFPEPQSTVLDASQGQEDALKGADQQFSRAIAQHKKVVLPVYINESFSLTLPKEVLPIPLLASNAKAMGHVQLPFDEDGIVRKVFLYYGVGEAYWPQLSLAGLQAAGDEPVKDRVEVESKSNPFSVIGREQKHIQFVGGPSSIASVSYSDVIAGKIPREQWAGKFVFVGATAQGLGDYIPTPVGYMSGVEFHANVLHAIRQQGFIKIMPLTNNTVYLTAIFILFAFYALRLSPKNFLIATVSSVLASLVVAFLGFVVFGWWASVLPFSVAMIILYPLWSWRRIELALRFLQKELNDLTQAQSMPAFSNAGHSVDVQLAGLEKAGVIHDWTIEEASAATEDKCWPEHFFNINGDDWLFSTTYLQDGRAQALSFSTVLNRRKTCEMVDSLLGDTGEASNASSDSFELVEYTISQIREAQSEVEHVQQRMNNSMALLQDAVLLSDLSGRIVFKNLAAEKLFDKMYEGDSVASLEQYFSGKLWPNICCRLLVEDEAIYQELILSASVKVGVLSSLEAGKSKILLCQASRLVIEKEQTDNEEQNSSAGSYYLYVFTDVSQLREAEQSKRETLAFLSHDMRSPIVSQLATITRARESKALSPDYNDMLDKLAQFGRRSLKYSEDFLQLTRAENIDKKEFYLVDLHGVVDGAVAEQQGFALQKNIKIKINRCMDDAWIEGDAQLLERAVSNLVANAIQHSAADSEVTVGLRLDSELMISIKDQGIGMETDTLEKLFEPYFRVRTRRKNRSESGRAMYGVNSYGLGLSFVHTVVTRLGGRIVVDSTPDVGTEFKLYFTAVEHE